MAAILVPDETVKKLIKIFDLPEDTCAIEIRFAVGELVTLKYEVYVSKHKIQTFIKAIDNPL